MKSFFFFKPICWFGRRFSRVTAKHKHRQAASCLETLASVNNHSVSKGRSQKFNVCDMTKQTVWVHLE